MGKYQDVFRRYELKYILTPEEKNAIADALKAHMHPDEYGRSTICNLYYDTPSYLLARRSIEGPLYKEKLRLRSYGTATESSTAFAELKKKYDGVVYKRRINLPYADAYSYLSGNGLTIPRTQITDELDWLLGRYEGLEPRIYLSYEREAFYSDSDRDFRITFDESILWRDTELNLTVKPYGRELLPRKTLMEIKTAGAIPLWLTEVLTQYRINKTPFSKYGNAYKEKNGLFVPYDIRNRSELCA